MRNLEIQQAPMSHIPEAWVQTWHEGNLIYPQSFAGYNAKLGPILVRELTEGRLSLAKFVNVPFEKKNLESLSEHSNAVHKKIGIPIEITPTRIEMLWSTSLTDISRCLIQQIDRCVTPDSKLEKVLVDPYRRNEAIDLFFQSKKYQKHFGWIRDMWDVASQTILSGPLKAKGKILFQTIIDMHKNQGVLPDSRGDTVMKPIWYEIRDVTKRSVLEKVKLPFTPRRNRRLVDDFVYDFASGNVIQSAQVGDYARL